MKSLQSYSIRVLRTVSIALLVFYGAGCTDQKAVKVLLQVRQPTEGDQGRLDIHAQVTGEQAGLRYKWLSVAGECEPQESDRPATLFRFAEGVMRDRVSVELWRNDQRVALAEIDVKRDQLTAPMSTESHPEVQIKITKIPPYEPEGGPETRAEIAGNVRGRLSPDMKVVIYARADAWYIQPSAYASHSIGPDNTWSSWTHTGSSYAALVVRQGFDPFLRLDVLPQVGRYVLGRTIVEGARK